MSSTPLRSATVFAAGEDLVLGLVDAHADVLSRAVSAVAGDQDAAADEVDVAAAGDQGAADDEVDVAAHAARFERRRQLIEKLSDPAVILGSRHAVLRRARRGLAHSRARRAG